MSTPKFAETHNLVAFLEKPKESNGFEEIIDFLNASSVQYALTVNPTIYTTCIEQFWTSAKVKTVNGERQIQALVDKKKVIISETSIRSDLKLDDAEGTDCLPTATIFAELERMGYENLTQKLTFYKAYFSSQWKFLIHTILQFLSAKTTSWNEFSSTMASAIIYLATNQKFNLSKYIFDNMVKNLDGRVKFLMYPRFVQVFLDKQVEGMSKHKGVYVTHSHAKKVFANMKRPCKGFSGRVTPSFSTMMVQATKDIGADSATPADSHSIPIITQPSSSKPQKKNQEGNKERIVLLQSLLLKRLLMRNMSLPLPMIHLQVEKVLDLEKAKTAQVKEITSLKKRVKQLEKRRKSRTSGLRRLRKVEEEIKDLDADAEVTLVNETQEMNYDNLMFDTGVLEEQEIKFEKVVEEPVVSVATTTKSIPVSVAEVVPYCIIIVRGPGLRGIIYHDSGRHVPASTKTFSSSQSQLSQVKDKGKGKMVEPEVPLKKKDQVALDEEMARNLEA
ncbi:hypothetical protein Tco_1491898 [Tanacetum coccineum]